MSRFFNKRLEKLSPYVPGEQPQDKKYIKLNTNESPFAPSKQALSLLATQDWSNLRLYPEPDTDTLLRAIADYMGVSTDKVFIGNGSDEVLAFIFQAFGDKNGFAFPDVTYGFYPVYASLFGTKYQELPVDSRLAARTDDYLGIDADIVLANPNAQTGIYTPLAEIEKILKGNPDNVVIIDEAYIDFGGESAIPLIESYRNLIVVRTFSKSRNLAGLRVGFAVGDPSLIEDIKRIKYSFNSYNVNTLSAMLAKASLADTVYFEECTRSIIETRDNTIARLRAWGYETTDSMANFILAKSPRIEGESLYRGLRDRGILVRRLSHPKISDYIRVTIGTEQQMTTFLEAIKELEK